MLNSKTARLIIALIAAVLIWGYVVGEVNPSKTKTIRNIPITYTYEEALNERGLAVSGATDEYLSMEISGARAILGYVTPNDISATVNVASAQKGDNEMSITIKVPSGITVNKQSVAKTTVTVENLTQKQVPVEIIYSGDFESGDQASTVNMSSNQVLVSGAESLVEKVMGVRGVIDAASVGEKLSAVQCQLYPVDKDNKEMDGIKLSQRNISVTTILARTKEVPLEVTYKSNPEDKYIRETSEPKTVKIFGNVDALEKVEKMVANAVDLSAITEDAEIKLEFSLPDGVTLAEGEEPVAKVKVSPIENKEFTFTSEEVIIEGGSDGNSYTLPAGLSITVTASDKKSVIDALTKEDFELSVDVSKMGNSGTAELKVECNKDVFAISVSPESVNVEMAVVTEGSGN